jgi:transcriptional regulator with XRE-family HTH domain
MDTIENNMPAFGKYLFDLRIKADAKPSSLAAVLDVHPSTIASWEEGKSLPNILVLKQLSILYGVTVDDFFSILSPPENKEPPLPPLPDPTTMVKPDLPVNERQSDDKRIPSLKSMTQEQQEHLIFATLMIIVLLIARVFAPLNFALCLLALFLLSKKALHSGWLYFVIVFCIVADINTILGWFFH